jgi:hypothetical protein
VDATDLSRLADAISHAVAPTFLLGATAAFVSLLMGRFNGILDRIRYVNLIDEQDPERGHLKSDLPRLKKRARLINDAILAAVASAACTVFVLALILFGASLISLGREVRIALTDYDFA